MNRTVASFGVLILVVAGAAAIRLVRLDNRPMHTDEAVHAFKFGDLLERGYYVYDPHEYHGPTLNYMSIPVVRMGGGNSLAQTTEADLRLAPAICGILLIAGLWLIRDGIGRTAMLCAAVLCAASPAMIFYSRYYIQEMLLVCFTFFALAAFWRCAADRNIVLRIFWMIVAGACLGLMHATKETCIIAMFAMGAAGFCAMLFSLLRATKPQESAEQPAEPEASFGDKLGFCAIAGVIVLIAAVAVSVTMFSSLFTNADGPWDSIATYGNYFTQAGGEGSAGSHSYPWHHYLRIVGWWRVGDGTVWSEAFVLGLAAVGLIAGLIGRGCGKASIPLLRFLCIYTVVMTAVYSLISYKTPWCLLGFFHGMILLAGVGAAVLLRIMRSAPLKAIVAVLLLVGTGHLGWQGWRASFPQCADPGNPYVYAHPTWDVPELADKVRGIASQHPDKNNMHVQ
ncbi:MAG: TIGR03663 family protein, partial [Phycisphaerae bacterium]|nr:TIGR03663 family protein [Phycisphaerae bacterium]